MGIVSDCINTIKDSNRNVKWFMLCVFLNGVVSSALSVMLSIYYKNIGLAEGAIGTLMSVRTFGTSIGAIGAIILLQKMGSKKGLMLSFVAMMVCGFAFVNITIPVVMQVSSFIFGVGQAIFLVVQAPFLKKNSTPETAVSVFSVSFVISNIAMFLGSFAFGWMSDIFAIFGGIVFGSATVLNIAFVLIGFILLALMRIDFVDEKPKDGAKTGVRDYLKVLDRNCLLYMLKVALIGMGAGLVVPFFSVYIKHALGASDSVVGVIMGFSQVGTVIGGLSVGRLTRRFGRVRTVIACQLLSIPFLFSISLPQGAFVMAISFFFRSTFMNMANPILQSLAMDLVAEEHRTVMSSLFSLADNLFRAGGMYAAGIIMQVVSYNAPYYVTIVLYLLSTLVIYFLFGKNEKFKDLR